MGNDESRPANPEYKPLEPVVETVKRERPTARDLIPDVAEASRHAAEYEAQYGPPIAAWLDEWRGPGAVVVAKHVKAKFGPHLLPTRDGRYEITIGMDDFYRFLFTTVETTTTSRSAVVSEMYSRRCSIHAAWNPPHVCRYCDALQTLAQSCLGVVQAAFEEKGYSWTWAEDRGEFTVSFTPQ